MQVKRNIIMFLLISLILTILIFIDLSTGQINIPFKEILKFLSFREIDNAGTYLLIKEFRFPRVFIAILSGASLAV